MLLPFVLEEPLAVTFEAVVPDLRMPVVLDDFFGAVDLTAILWVVEALMDAMVRLLFSTAMQMKDKLEWIIIWIMRSFVR